MIIEGKYRTSHHLTVMNLAGTLSILILGLNDNRGKLHFSAKVNFLKLPTSYISQVHFMENLSCFLLSFAGIQG